MPLASRNNPKRTPHEPLNNAAAPKGPTPTTRPPPLPAHLAIRLKQIAVEQDAAYSSRWGRMVMVLGVVLIVVWLLLLGLLWMIADVYSGGQLKADPGSLPALLLFGVVVFLIGLYIHRRERGW